MNRDIVSDICWTVSFIITPALFSSCTMKEKELQKDKAVFEKCLEVDGKYSNNEGNVTCQL